MNPSRSLFIACGCALISLGGGCRSHPEEPSFSRDESPARSENAGADEGETAGAAPATKAPPTGSRAAPSTKAPPAGSGGAIAVPPDVAAPPADAERTASGLASKVLRPGTGTRHPGPTSHVEVHYTGWTTDGHMFDSSVARGEPASFPLAHVIAGWTEGLQLMVQGERRRFWIPQGLAYQGRPGAPAGMLVFDVELLRIID